jgi:uncharacterized membrane protein YheB (UPF0754 family)
LSPEILRGVLTVIFGALAGGLTNTVAVWMLFHPHEPARIGRLRLPFLHGAIPKNQDRLAEAVGRAVGDRLLTAEDLSQILSSPEFRDAFEQHLTKFFQEALERERGSLGDSLPPELRSLAEELLAEASTLLEDRLDGWLTSSSFEDWVEVQVEEFFARVTDLPVGDTLTPAREAVLVESVNRWLVALVERPGFERAVHDYIERLAADLLRDDRTFEEVLPEPVVASIERGLAAYLPVAVEKLGGILEAPEARARLEVVLNDLFHRFLHDLRFHQRLMARLIVTEESLERVLATLEDEGAAHLSEMLRDPAVQRAMAQRIRDAVRDFLERPVTDVLGRPGDENVERVREVLTVRILEIARDPDTREFLTDRLQQGLTRASSGSWGDLVEVVPKDRISGAIVATARSAGARGAYREGLRRVLRGVLEQPVGRPADWLPGMASSRIREALSQPLWSWLQAQTPHLIHTLDVRRRVEEKVKGYPTRKMEELVRRVTQRELRLIVRLGYVLGAVIGGVLVTVNSLLP